jgi:hypothetical protein
MTLDMARVAASHARAASNKVRSGLAYHVSLRVRVWLRLMHAASRPDPPAETIESAMASPATAAACSVQAAFKQRSNSVQTALIRVNQRQQMGLKWPRRGPPLPLLPPQQQPANHT